MSTFRNLLSKTSSVPGFVGGWKSYGRSNSEDASTRDILPDYSGNRRDIKLYNFAFSGLSGWNGYERNWDEWLYVYIGNNGHNYQENNVLHILEISPWANTLSDVVSGETVKLKLRVSGLSEDITNNEVQNIQLYFNASTAGSTLYIREDGDYDVNLTAPEGATKFYILAKSTETLTGWTPLTTPITIEQLPTYPGGLVSDGVDDYGQCIKGFSLPDDYTVVAIRRIIEGHAAAFTSKGATAGAFLFEVLNNTNKSGVVWSYGQTNSLTNAPDLFSYQSKASYNGQEISYGTAEDTAEDQLTVFHHGAQLYCKGVLYDLRIYDHSLSAEELQIVKDEMMSDYEKATGGGIADIHYVADWDGKGRSNDEDEPMRSTWTDRATGKVIDLHNFAFAGQSGWGWCERAFNLLYSGWNNNVWPVVETYKLQGYPSVSSAMGYWNIGSNKTKLLLRISGISETNNIYIQQYNTTPIYAKQQLYNGLNEIEIDLTGSSRPNYNYLTFVADSNYTTPVTIEQLPLYPGALVGDGIDDYGVTQEAINEEVGTILLHYRRLIEVPTKWGYYYDGLNSTRIFAAYTNTSPYFHSSLMEKYNDGNLFIGTTSQTADALLYIMSNNWAAERGQVAIFRLILIREQLDDAQVEFLRWKVEKEYREWCRANGYEYAINQLTE